MSTYVPKSAPPHPLGLHKPLFHEIRKRQGLDEEGKPVRTDGEEDEDTDDPGR